MVQIMYGKYYLIETKGRHLKRDKGYEFGEDYGAGSYGPSRYGAPKPYGYRKTSPPPPSCNWDQWSAWSGKSGCESQRVSRNRKCRCSDGSEGSSNRCGGGQKKEGKSEPDTCVKCTWDQWSNWASRKGCEKQEVSRTRSCQCSDGSEGPAQKCNGGQKRERRELADECPLEQETTPPQPAPRPYGYQRVEDETTPVPRTPKPYRRRRH